MEPWKRRYKFSLVVPQELMETIKEKAKAEDRTITLQIIHYIRKGIEASNEPTQHVQ